MKKIFILVVLFSVVLSAVGCRQSYVAEEVQEVVDTIPVVGGYGVLSFSGQIPVSDMRKFDGERVTINGYMARLQGGVVSVVYIMDAPGKVCVFCEDNTNVLANTIAVNPRNAVGLEDSMLPVTVRGVLKFEDVTDDLGNSYAYRITDAVISPLDMATLTPEDRFHIELLSEGFDELFADAMSWVYQTLNYSVVGLTRETLPSLEEGVMLSLNAMVQSSNEPYAKEVRDLVFDLSRLVNDTNAAVVAKDWESFARLNARGQALFDRFYSWKTVPRI